MSQHRSEGPLVSVVVICFNHARFVAQCLDSVLAQTYPRVEVFVVDNGSTDDSAAVIASHPQAARFTFIRNENIGLVAALNGMRGRLAGSYYSFVAADDYWCPHKLAAQVELMEGRPELGACSGYIRNVDEDGRELWRPRKRLAAHDVTFEDLLLSRYYFPAPVALVRVAALDDVGWYDAAFALEDYPLWLAMTDRGWKLHCLGDALGYYRRHASNVSKRVDYIHAQQAAILERYREHPMYPGAMAMLRSAMFLTYAKHDKRRALGMLPTLSRSTLSASFVRKGLFYLCVPGPLMRRLGIE